MTTNPENPEAAGEAVPAPQAAEVMAPAEQEFGVKSVRVDGVPPDKPGFVLGLAVTIEALVGLFGVLGGLALAVWGCFMIKDGVQGQVAFTLHFGEHNSLDVNTAVVGFVVMLVGLVFALFVRGKTDWKATGKSQAPAGTETENP